MDETVRPPAGDTAFLANESEMARLIQDFDWAATPLGAIEGWPQVLRSAVGIMLDAPGPISILWGPDCIQIYNDTYIALEAGRHPASLGKPAAQNWSKAYHSLLRPIFERVFAGEAVTIRDQHIEVPSADVEDTPERYFTANFSPIRNEAGVVVGIFHPVTETTKRVLAERALRESEEFNRRVLQASADCIKVLDLEGRLEFMSEGGMCVMEVEDFGAIQGAFWPDFWRGEEHAKAQAAVEDAKRGRTGRLQGFATTMKGSPRWWDVIVTPINGADGRPEKLLSVSRDVTAAKEAEERLRESETRFRLMADAVPQIVWITDATGRMEFFNRQFTDYTGAQSHPKDPAEAAARFMHPDDGPHVVVAFEAALRSGASFEVEHRIRSASGEERWFLARAQPYRDPEGGEIVRWFGASVDIHDRKLLEERLRELNETLEARVVAAVAERQVLADIVESSTAATLALDLDYNILAINQANVAAIERVYGKRPQAGDNLLELLADMPEHQQQVRKTWGRALAGEEFVVVDEFGDESHERAIFEVRFNILRDRAGMRIGATQTAYDVSERVRAQAELEATQEQLRQSQKMEAMGSLTGGVAHDFNNLLTPIIASLDMLLRRGIGGERERRLMDGALQSAERAKVLVQRLLAFARRQPLQPGPVDVARLVGGMAELIASTSGPRVDVRVEMPDALPPAVADANQLEMALLNLAVNARDAMPEGGVLTISAARVSVRERRHSAKLRPGHYVRLSVRDTGAGMDEATLARAVEPFFSTKGVGRGTGLGLSMVHGLASQLGGGLTIASSPGQGTTVELWLPLSAAPLGEEGQNFDVVAPTQVLGRALLVDDEVLVRMSTADMLTDLGYEVVEASSAEEALRLIDEELNPDLIVTDHLMPGLSGVDLARDLRSRRPDLPVLIVSGYAEMDGIAPGFPRLTKPFRAAELAGSLAALRPAGAK